MTNHLMKFVLVLVSIIILEIALAQSVVPCSENALFQVDDRQVWLHDSFIRAIIIVPARFPNPATSEIIIKPFQMKCRTFVAKTSNSEFRISGDVRQNFRRLISVWKEGHPDNSKVIPGRVVFVFHGDFTYPNIRKNWSQERIYLDLVKDKLVFFHDNNVGRIKNDVVAVRINGGSLKPVFFDNKVTQIKFGSIDLLEFYLKGGNVQFDYMSLNFKRNIITIRNGIDFPSK